MFTVDLKQYSNNKIYGAVAYGFYPKSDKNSYMAALLLTVAYSVLAEKCKKNKRKEKQKKEIVRESVK